MALHVMQDVAITRAQTICPSASQRDVCFFVLCVVIILLSRVNVIQEHRYRLRVDTARCCFFMPRPWPRIKFQIISVTRGRYYYTYTFRSREEMLVSITRTISRGCALNRGFNVCFYKTVEDIFPAIKNYNPTHTHTHGRCGRLYKIYLL